MSNRKVRIAVVGAGHVAQVAHIPVYKSHPNVELTAVVDQDPIKARRIQEQHGFELVFDDFTAMLKSSDVDAVDICTPNYLHAPMAITALRSGRHVLCEKPLARTMDEASRMVEESEKSGRILMTALNNRFREDVQVLHKFVKGGELGDVQLVKTGWLRRATEWKDRAWFTEKAMSGGGALLDLGMPIMDLALWVAELKKPTRVSCSIFGKKGRSGVEDSACAMVKFAGGACLMLEVNWNLREPNDVTFLHVYGSKGAGILKPLQIHKSIQGVLVNVTPALDSKGSPYQESYRADINHFIECVLEKKKPMTTGADALPVLRLLDAMYESASTGKEVEVGS